MGYGQMVTVPGKVISAYFPVAFENPPVETSDYFRATLSSVSQ
jgi:hypothetical protein